jgi:Cd2+/Zn2+-exporting ATPase
MGLQGRVAGKEVLAGNTRLLDHFGISYDATIHDIVESIVVVAVNGVYAGYVLIADELKEDAGEALKALRSSGVTKIVMLSGDKDSITQKVAAALGIWRTDA